MIGTTFQTTVRSFLRREPFRPFLIELEDGQTILVDFPAMAFDEFGAGFIGLDQVFMFSAEQVREIRPAPQDQEVSI